MVKNILVIGLTPEHAGKTSLAQAILSHFSEKGYNTSGFKPFSGYNYWYHYDTAHHNLSQGRLFSKDIKKLQQHSTIDDETELFNPIHRLWNEPVLQETLTAVPPFIMDRFTSVDNNTSNHHLLINQQLNKQIPTKYKHKLEEKKYTIHSFNTIQSMNSIIQTYYNQAIETCYNHIKTKADIVLIESYADNALLPWNDLEGFDAVFGIKPWEIHKYDPEKYVKAVELSKPISAWETSTKKLTDLLKPIQVFYHEPSLSKYIVHGLKQIVPTMVE